MTLNSRGYVSGFSHYLEARRMLKHAAEDARLLPTALLDSKTAAMRDLAQVVIPVTKYMGLWGFPFNSLATTGEAYVNSRRSAGECGTRGTI